MSDKSKSSSAALLALILASADEVSQSKERAMEYLNEEGVPINSLFTESLKKIKKIQMELNAEKTRQKMNLLTLMKEKAILMAEHVMSNADFSFKEFVSQHQLSLHNRNLEHLSSEDIKSTLIDFYILKLAEEDKQNEI